MSSSSQGNETPYCPGPGGMNPCRRRRNQYWPRAILVAFHLTRAILAVEHNSMLSSFWQPQNMPSFPDNLQLCYYSCRHLAMFSHTTFSAFSVHCNYNGPIFPCTVCESIQGHQVPSFIQRRGLPPVLGCLLQSQGYWGRFKWIVTQVQASADPHLLYLMLFNDSQ